MSTLMLIWDLTWLFFIPVAALAVTGIVLGVRAIARAVKGRSKGPKKQKRAKTSRKNRSKLFNRAKQQAQERMAQQTQERQKDQDPIMPEGQNTEETVKSPSEFLKNCKNNFTHNIDNDGAIYLHPDELKNSLRNLQEVQAKKLASGVDAVANYEDKELAIANDIKNKFGFNPLTLPKGGYVAGVEDATGRKVCDFRNCIFGLSEENTEKFAKEFEENYNPIEEPARPIVGRFDRNGSSESILFSATDKNRAGKALQLCYDEIVEEAQKDASVFPITFSMIYDPDKRFIKKSKINSLEELNTLFVKKSSEKKQEDEKVDTKTTPNPEEVFDIN